MMTNKRINKRRNLVILSKVYIVKIRSRYGIIHLELLFFNQIKGGFYIFYDWKQVFIWFSPVEKNCEVFLKAQRLVLCDIPLRKANNLFIFNVVYCDTILASIKRLIFSLLIYSCNVFKYSFFLINYKFLRTQTM